jgi:hypothetical protein
MARCRVDKSIERMVREGFEFPLGVYPVEEMSPREGYTLNFEPADGGEPADEFEAPREFNPAGDDDDSGEPEGLDHDDEAFPGGPDGPDLGDTAEGGRGGPGAREGGSGGAGGLGGSGGAGGAGGAGGLGGPGGMGGGGADGLEEWPDRYVWDICIRASRLEALTRQLFALLPGRVFPILDVLGTDAYREIDPYVAGELVGVERFTEGIRLFRGFLYEDGLVGFGAMSDEPFVYVFVDEHKVVTVRAEVALKEKIERVLAAFDLQEVDQIAAADAAMHEHRSVLEAPDDRPDLLTADEIVEELRDLWGLYLNVDPDRNHDESGNELGIVGWRCFVRAMTAGEHLRYAEVLVTAGSLADAQELAVETVERLLADEPSSSPDDDEPSFDVLSADRIRPEDFGEALAKARELGAAVLGSGSTPPPTGTQPPAGLPVPKMDSSRVWASRWVDG